MTGRVIAREAAGSVEPGVKRSGTPGKSDQKEAQPAVAGDSPVLSKLSPATAG